MNIKKYEVFLKTVELNSITRAAEALGYTQSGVSHVISSLEDELGFPLLVRRKTGVLLTDDGVRIVPAVRAILNGSEQLGEIAASIRGLDSGTVRVGAFSSVAVHWLPGMIKDFLQDYPNIEFKLLNGDYWDVDNWISDGSIDIGFITTPTSLTCETVTICDDRLLAVLPADHPFAGKSRIPVGEVAKEPFISLLETSNQDTMKSFEKSGTKPRVRFTTKDDYAMIAMVEMGLGVSIMPELLLRGHAENVALLELDPPARRTIALAVADGARQKPATARFIDYIFSWLERHPEKR